MQYLAAPTIDSKILEMLCRLWLASVTPGPEAGRDPWWSTTNETGLLLILWCKTKYKKQNETVGRIRAPSCRKTTLDVSTRFL